MTELDPNSDEYAMQYGLEDGEDALHCPDCDWSVPHGMGYTFLTHREETDHGHDADGDS